MTARGTLAALLLPLALLSACGDDSGSTATDPVASDSSTASDTPTESSSPTEATATPTPDWPACSDIWVADGKIPMGYRGCLDGDQAVKADNLPCSSGQRMVRYDDRFYGVAGGLVYETMGPLDKDKQYLKMVATCRA